MKKMLFLTMGLWMSVTVSSQTALYIPDTISSATIALQMHQDSVSFRSGPKTKTFGFNAQAYLGPTLILKSGTAVSFSVTNHIGDTSTVHWHGLHVASVNDGGPHTSILPNATWYPAFTVLDKASTYWYHPHFHGKTALHALKGAAGMIIVRDAQEAALSLPRTYGVDDIPLIIQTQQLDSVNQVMPKGMEDSLLFVNGARANYGHAVYAALPAQIVRLRLLNAGGERNYNFGFSGNRTFHIIGSDGGLLNAPVTATRIRLAPGERSEILLDLSGLNGQTLYLMSYASELPMGVQGGPTMPMPPGNPPMDSPLNGTDYNILQIQVTAPTSAPIVSVPATLANNIPLVASQAVMTRTITMTAQNMMVMDGPFYFNNQLFDMMRIDYHIPLNNVEIWQLSNQTMVAHPFHLHDAQFYILDRDGNQPPAEERGRKDVVLVSPNETVRFITKFEDFADTTIPYMYHCHVLMHEDDGMMGQFVVMPPVTGIQSPAVDPLAPLVYPNPSSASLYIRFPDQNGVGEATINLYTSLGKRVEFRKESQGCVVELDTHQLAKGIYFIEIRYNSKTITKKISIE